MNEWMNGNGNGMNEWVNELINNLPMYFQLLTYLFFVVVVVVVVFFCWGMDGWIHH